MQHPLSSAKLRIISAGCLLSLGVCGPALSQSLTAAYALAKQNDAAYLAAQAQHSANLARAEQSKAAILPTAALSAGVSRSDSELTTTALIERQFTSRTASISASQPLYRPLNWATRDQAQWQVQLADQGLQVAKHDLILRTAQAYFDVLVAQESLAFVSAQKKAVAEQLAAAKRNFEVGTSTITDTREAQARFDLVSAQEIAAQSDAQIKSAQFETLLGKEGFKPLRLKNTAKLPEAQPVEVSAWLEMASKDNPAITVAKANLEVVKLETAKARAGHKPTLDLALSYGVSQNPNGSSTSAISSRSNVATIGLNFNLPLFAGFATQNRIKETLALEEKASADLDAAQRNALQSVRTGFYGLQSGLGQVRALEAAQISSQAALDANKLGYQVGVRINIDVLNSQSQLFQTQRDLAKARYDAVLTHLRLKQAAGQLQDADVSALDALLDTAQLSTSTPTPTPTQTR